MWKVCILLGIWNVFYSIYVKGNHHSFISEMDRKRHNDHQKDEKRYSGGHIILDGIKSAFNFIVQKAADFMFGGIFSVVSRISSAAYRALTWSTPSKMGGGTLFLSCLSFCHSVLLSETLTLLITFEQSVLKLWYFTWIFPVIRHFHQYHFF